MPLTACPLLRLLLLMGGLLATPATHPASGFPLTKGVFLVATENLHGTSFSKTVILVTQIDAQGAMGLAINRRSQSLLKDFFPAINPAAGTAELYLGGPVHPLALFVLTHPNPGTGWASILGETALSGGESAIQYLAQSQTNKSSRRVYAGYAGWSPGQLRAEIERGDWRIVPGDQKIIFSTNPDEIWEKLSKIPTENWI